MHAEQFLLANLLLHKEQELKILAISAAPCGHCRQFFSELSCAVCEHAPGSLLCWLSGSSSTQTDCIADQQVLQAVVSYLTSCLDASCGLSKGWSWSQLSMVPLQDTVQFVFGHAHKQHHYCLKDLLPDRFGPADLLTDPDIPLLLQAQHHKLSWHPSASELLATGQHTSQGFQQAADAAFDAASKVGESACSKGGSLSGMSMQHIYASMGKNNISYTLCCLPVLQPQCCGHCLGCCMPGN